LIKKHTKKGPEIGKDFSSTHSKESPAMHFRNQFLNSFQVKVKNFYL